MPLSEFARNGLLDGLHRNTPFVVSVFCGSLYKADPGVEGGAAEANLIPTEAGRSQINMSAANDGAGANTGDPAFWVIGAVDGLVTVTDLGLHDQITAGNWLGREHLKQPVAIAEGDKVTLTSFTSGMN